MKSHLSAGPQATTMVEVRCRTMRQERRYRHATVWVPSGLQHSYSDLVAPFADLSLNLRFDLDPEESLEVGCQHIRPRWETQMVRCPPSGAPLVGDCR